MSPTFKTWASSSLFSPPFYKIAVKCCEPMRYSVCVLFAHKKHLNRTVALAGLLPCLFSVLCKVSSHTQRGWGRDQIHKGFLGKVSVCAKAKGGGLFFPLQTSCYIYSKDSAASNSHWRGGGTCTAQMYLRFFLSPDSISTHCQRIALWMKSSRVCSQVTTKSNHSYFV